jgi:DinB superfamily
MSPSEVVREVLGRIEARRYEEVAAFVDAEALRSMMPRQRAMVREAPRVTTEADIRRGQPDLPDEVIAYYLRQHEDIQQRHDPLKQAFAGVSSVEELDRLSDAEAFGRMLEARQRDYQVRVIVEAEGDRIPSEVRDVLPERVEAPPVRVIGEVVDGDRAYVLHRGGGTRVVPAAGVQIQLLRRDDAGEWKLDPESLLHGDGEFVTMVAFDGAPADAAPEHAPSGPQPMQRAWTERTFESGLEPDRFPAILERFRATTPRLEDLLMWLDQDALRWHPEPSVPGGRRPWSIQQHIGHLLDLEALGEMRLRAYLDGAGELPAADMTNRRTDEADHEGRNVHDVVHDFEVARRRLIAVVERMGADDLRRTAFHPRLKQPMTVVDWVLFMCEHDDHHFARIAGLRRAWVAAGKPAAADD